MPKYPYGIDPNSKHSRKKRRSEPKLRRESASAAAAAASDNAGAAASGGNIGRSGRARKQTVHFNPAPFHSRKRKPGSESDSEAEEGGPAEQPEDDSDASSPHSDDDPFSEDDESYMGSNASTPRFATTRGAAATERANASARVVRPAEFSLADGPMTVCLFNAKGGVMKTTHTWTLGATLARSRAMNVLLVDLDSQSDLTRTVLREKITDAAARQATPLEDAGLSWYFGPENTEAMGKRSVRAALDELFGGCPLVETPEPEEISPAHRNAGSLHVLFGSQDMAEIDGKVAQADFQLDDPTRKPWHAGVWQAIQKAAAKVKADIVLVDLNPYLGSLNRNIITSSDYVVLCTCPEDFSCENLDTFMNKLARNDKYATSSSGSWLQLMLNHIRPAVNTDTPQGYKARIRLPDNILPGREEDGKPVFRAPKLLGYVIARFQARQLAGNAIEGAVQDRANQEIESEMDRIHARVKKLMNTYRDLDVAFPARAGQRENDGKLVHLALPNEVYTNLNLHVQLAKIRDNHALGPISQKHGVPVPFLRDQHLQVRLNGKQRRKQDKELLLDRVRGFATIYDQFAYNILALANADVDAAWHGDLDWALVDRSGAEWGGGGPQPKDGNKVIGGSLGYA